MGYFVENLPVRVRPVGVCGCVCGLWVCVRAWPVGEGACVACGWGCVRGMCVCVWVSVCVCVSGVSIVVGQKLFSLLSAWVFLVFSSFFSFFFFCWLVFCFLVERVTLFWQYFIPCSLLSCNGICAPTEERQRRRETEREREVHKRIHYYHYHHHYCYLSVWGNSHYTDRPDITVPVDWA